MTDEARTAVFLRIQQVADWLEERGLDTSQAWKRRDPQEPGRRRKEAKEDEVYAFFMRYWRKQKKEVRTELERLYPDRKSVKFAPRLQPDDKDLARLIRILVEAAQDGVDIFDEQINLTIDYELVNEEAAEWARKYAYDLVNQIDTTTQAVLQKQVTAFVETPGMTLRDIMTALPYSEKRALKIATTEVTRAYAEGNQKAGEQLQREFPDVKVVKVWYTNQDDRVCEICGPLAGESVGIDEDFPGGTNPPAHVSCRCWMMQSTRLVEEGEEGVQEPRTFATQQEADEWARQQAGLNPSLTPEQNEALRQYKGDVFYEINQDLREGGYIEDDYREAIANQVDAAMAKARLTESVTVFRGADIDILDYEDADMTGSVFQDSAFVSTTLNEKMAGRFADGLIMEIRLPEGSRGLWMEHWKVEGVGSESEILLPRGSRFNVVRDSYDDDEDMRHLVMEVIP
jgi:SPP1 gp7 family putative phage head morphogenesis protein